MASGQTLQRGQGSGCGSDRHRPPVSFIDQEDVDLVILGTHGYGALERALIGSVSSKVARAAGCPVLLVSPAD